MRTAFSMLSMMCLVATTSGCPSSARREALIEFKVLTVTAGAAQFAVEATNRTPSTVVSLEMMYRFRDATHQLVSDRPERWTSAGFSLAPGKSMSMDVMTSPIPAGAVTADVVLTYAQIEGEGGKYKTLFEHQKRLSSRWPDEDATR